MNEQSFLNIVTNISLIDNTLVLSDLDVKSYRIVKSYLNATIAAAANARLEYSEFCEEYGEAF